MNILIFTRYFLAATQTFIYKEVIALSKNYNVKVICCTRKDESYHPFQALEVIPYKKGRWRGKIENLLYNNNVYYNAYEKNFARRLMDTIKAFQPDVIHCHFGTNAPILLDNLPHNLSVPVMIHFHGHDASRALIQSPIYRKKLQTFFSRPYIHPVFVSHFMYKNVTETHGIIPDKKRILYYGTSLSFFRRENYDTDVEKVFLQVSSFVEKKGHFITLKAFQQFLSTRQENKHRLILAGNGSLLEDVKAEANRLGISENVFFPGWVDREKCKVLMEKADYFLHHSITDEDGDTEGIPNAIMEAMAMELPILSTYHAGIPELVEDGTHGYLIEEKDTKTYAKRMEDILSWTYKKENRHKVEQLFEWQKHIDQLTAYYEEVTNPE